MNELHRYLNHWIDLELIEVTPGLYRWLYMIDAEHFGKSSEVLQGLYCARTDALRFARHEIDEREVADPKTQVKAVEDGWTQLFLRIDRGASA